MQKEERNGEQGRRKKFHNKTIFLSRQNCPTSAPSNLLSRLKHKNNTKFMHDVFQYDSTMSRNSGQKNTPSSSYKGITAYKTEVQGNKRLSRRGTKIWSR
jgi:hypothetical protein